MKIKEITVSVSFPLIIDKYEQLKPFISLTAELEEGDDLDVCCRYLHLKAAEQCQHVAARDLKMYAAVKGIRSLGVKTLEENIDTDLPRAIKDVF